MVKRLLDIVVSLLALVVLLPVLGIVAILVFSSMGRPVFFRQTRPGKNGELFDIYKFRTMREGSGSDAERMTPFGRFLRTMTLDELPQFINVLKGEMSLIGPRPLPAIYLERYTSFQARRHEVRPGITGLAQVRGRNSIGWIERFNYDVYYVDNQSWALDARIIFETVLVLLNRSGIAAEGHETMPEFTVASTKRHAIGVAPIESEEGVRAA